MFGLVTPCVGVWIETFEFWYLLIIATVTPCVGVWIETFGVLVVAVMKKSHPAWVCGLKRKKRSPLKSYGQVTPCVGVWIETAGIQRTKNNGA